jgi:hypothetical protein
MTHRPASPSRPTGSALHRLLAVGAIALNLSGCMDAAVSTAVGGATPTEQKP